MARIRGYLHTSPQNPLHTARFGENAQRFPGKLLPNNLKISAQLKAHFHALCLKAPINSSLAQCMNICLWVAQSAWKKGLNECYPIPTIFV
jgi:hypothetical protein